MQEKILKKHTLSALILTALIALLEVLEKTHLVGLLAGVNDVILPVMFLLVFAYVVVTFKDSVSFKSKWVWVPVFILATYALMNFVRIFTSIAPWSLASLISGVLLFSGYGIVLWAILNENYLRFFPIGLGILALDWLICVFNGHNLIVSILGFILYGVLALLALERFTKIRPLLRWIAILLILFNISGAGINSSLLWLVIALLFSPLKKVTIDFGKIIALLCVVLTVLSVGALLSNGINNTASIDEEIDSLNEERAKYKTVEEYEALIAECSEKLDPLNSEKKTLQAQYNRAEDALENVCYWSYYSAYWCDGACKPYHDAERAAFSKLSECTQKVSELNEDKEDAEYAIERINYIKERLLSLYSDKIEIVLVYALRKITGLAVVAGLICLSVVLWKKKYGKLSLISCGLLGGSSLLSVFLNGESAAWCNFDLLNYPIFGIVLSASFVGLLLISIMAGIFIKRESRPVKLRVSAIIFSMIFVALSIASMPSTALYSVLFALIIVCTSLLLVPVRFVEYHNIGKHIFLGMITFGIWNMIWIYNVTKNLNCVSEYDERKPVAELLLCLFMPFYAGYWFYKTAERVDSYAVENGKKSKITVISLVFGLICPIVPYILIQDKINQIVGKPEIAKVSI